MSQTILLRNMYDNPAARAVAVDDSALEYDDKVRSLFLFFFLSPSTLVADRADIIPRKIRLASKSSTRMCSSNYQTTEN
jgi:hypothetical protein